MEARSGQFLLDLPHYEICSRSGSDASSNTAAVWVHGGLQYMFGGRDFGGGDSLPFFPLLVVFRELGSLGFAVKHLQWCCLGCAQQELEMVGDTRVGNGRYEVQVMNVRCCGISVRPLPVVCTLECFQVVCLKSAYR